MNFTESNSLNQCLTLLTKVKDYNEISFTLLANRVQFGTPYCHFDDDLMMTENRRFFGFLKYSSIRWRGRPQTWGRKQSACRDTPSLRMYPFHFWAGLAAVTHISSPELFGIFSTHTIATPPSIQPLLIDFPQELRPPPLKLVASTCAHRCIAVTSSSGGSKKGSKYRATETEATQHNTKCFEKKLRI